MGREAGGDAFTAGAPNALASVETWKLQTMNEAFLEAQESRVWEPDAEQTASTVRPHQSQAVCCT